MNPSRIVATALLLNAALFLSACDKTEHETANTPVETARPAKIVSVISTRVNALRTYPGTLEATQKAELAFRVGGQLTARPAQPGLRVKKGDLLARLDEAVYRNTLKERKARYELAKIQHDQAHKLVKQKLSSRLQYDQAIAEMKSAKAALDQARDNLEYTHLLAPFDGIVGRVNVENFQTIQAKEPVIQLQDDHRLDIHFSIPETLIAQLKKIENAEIVEGFCGIVRFSTHPEKCYRACYKEHESVPDSLTRSYSTVFSLNPIIDFAVLPGMTATIELDFSRFMPDAQAKWLLVPLESVFEKTGKTWVWRLDSTMHAVQTPVEVGSLEGKMLEITKGLSLNDKVIAAGVSYVREGMLLKPLIKERGL